MEIKKRIVVCLVILITGISLGQKKDTIEFKIDLKKLHAIAEENVKDRHKFTVEKQDSLVKVFELNPQLVLSRYQFEEFKITVIPVFELDKKVKLDNKINFLNYLTNKKKYNDLFYNGYVDDEIVLDDFYVEYQYPPKLGFILAYSLLGDNYSFPERIGGDRGFMMKLGLEKKYFAFYIKGLLPLFIVENGIVYAITNPTNEGGYDKMEINEYMGTMVGENNLKRILMSECTFCSLKKVSIIKSHIILK